VASDHILLIENPADLSIDIGRLRIRRAGLDDAFVAPGDIAVLVLHHHTIVCKRLVEALFPQGV